MLTCRGPPCNGRGRASPRSGARKSLARTSSGSGCRPDARSVVIRPCRSYRRSRGGSFEPLTVMVTGKPVSSPLPVPPLSIAATVTSDEPVRSVVGLNVSLPAPSMAAAARRGAGGDLQGAMVTACRTHRSVRVDPGQEVRVRRDEGTRPPSGSARGRRSASLTDATVSVTAVTLDCREPSEAR